MSEEHRDNGHERDTVKRTLIAYYTATTRDPPDVAQSMWQLVAPWLVFAREGASGISANAQNEAAASGESQALPAIPHLRIRAFLARGGAVAITLMLIVLLVIVVVATFRH